MQTPEEPPANAREWLARAARDPSLWPVFIAGFLSFSTFGAAMLVLALQDRNPFAMAALAIVIVVSGRELGSAWMGGRRGVAAAIAALWLLSAAGAAMALTWLPRA